MSGYFQFISDQLLKLHVFLYFCPCKRFGVSRQVVAFKIHIRYSLVNTRTYILNREQIFFQKPSSPCFEEYFCFHISVQYFVYSAQLNLKRNNSLLSGISIKHRNCALGGKRKREGHWYSAEIYKVLNSLLSSRLEMVWFSFFEIQIASYLEETIQAELRASWNADEFRDCWGWLSVIFFYEKWSIFLILFDNTKGGGRDWLLCTVVLREVAKMIISQGKWDILIDLWKWYTTSQCTALEWTFEDVEAQFGASRGTEIGANNANQTSNQPSSSTGRTSNLTTLRRRFHHTLIKEWEAADQVIGCAGTSSSQCLHDNVPQILINHPAATMTSRLVLVIGDLHIPDRALDIPAKVSSLPICKHIS